MFSNHPLGLLDVVCGEPADVNSAHRYVHGGALFCFCSDECLARFIVDPHQFLPRLGQVPPPGGAMSASDAATVARAATRPGQVRDGATADVATPMGSAVLAQVAAAAHPAADDDAPPEQISVRKTTEPIRVPRGAHFVDPAPSARRAPAPTLGPIPVAPTRTGTLFAPLFAWREKRFAVRTCADMLRLHEIVAALHPGLSGPPLYRQIVAAHHGGDLAYADAVLESAEQSFAIWPVQRALRFADVVHYVAASEFLASAGGARWIHADMKRIVAARIPHDL